MSLAHLPAVLSSLPPSLPRDGIFVADGRIWGAVGSGFGVEFTMA